MIELPYLGRLSGFAKTAWAAEERPALHSHGQREIISGGVPDPERN